MTQSVNVRVAAKLNLMLGVGPLRADGYHPVTSVLQSVGLYDEVRVAAADAVSCEVSGEGASEVGAAADNLAVVAARALAAYTGVSDGVHIAIRKAIPVAGGMAGGSADAAATLVACDRLWRTGLSRDGLSQLGAQLGSDVPFCLQGGTALATGRGERLAPVLARGRFHWTFALAESGLSTADVYGEYDLAPTRSVASADEVLSALRSGEPKALGAALRNDLEPAALRLRPALRRTLEAGRDLGALGAVVAGSGPTCAFLSADADDAVRLAAALAGAGVCRTVRTAAGPVPGPS